MTSGAGGGKVGRPAKMGRTVQVGFRLPIWLVELIDSISPGVSQRAGRDLNRTEVATYLMLLGLGEDFIKDLLVSDQNSALKQMGELGHDALSRGLEDQRKFLEAMNRVSSTQTALAWLEQNYPKWIDAKFLARLRGRPTSKGPPGK